MSSSLAIVVSTGERETGARAARPIWIDYMEAAMAARPYQDFDIPAGVRVVHMDPRTGSPMPQDAPGAVAALFKKK